MPRAAYSQDNWHWMLALGLVMAAVVFCYPLLLDVPLLDPDEALHAVVAQEMVDSGDWLTPRFLGEPFLDRPILYFWVEAASLRLLGMYEAAVRLPGLLFGLLGVVTTAAVGWRMFGRGVGLTAGTFYAGMVLPAALAQAAAPDVALVPSVNMAILLFWESERGAGRRARLVYVSASGLLLGLACLTKGLAGVALVGVAYGGYRLVCRRLTLVACLQGAAALGVAALIAAAWYVPAELHRPGYLHYFFVERHLLGYVTGTQAHGSAAWWYYLPLLLGGGLPWIAYLPVLAQDAWLSRNGTADRLSGECRRPWWAILRPSAWGRWVGRWGLSRFLWQEATEMGLSPSAPPRESGQPRRCGEAPAGAMPLLWCWLIGCTLFLSVSHSKLITYIWPVFPAVAILAAVAWVRLLQGSLADPARRLAVRTIRFTCLGGAALLPAAMLAVQPQFAVRFTAAVWVLSVLVAMSIWIALWPLSLGRLRAVLSVAVLSLAAQYVAIMAVVLPPVASNTSARDLAGYFNRLGRVPPRVVVVEERIGSLVFYLEPGLRAGLQPGQLLGVPLRECGLLGQLPSGGVVALAERYASSAAGPLELDGAPYARAGRYRVYDASRVGPRSLTASAAAPDGERRR